MSKNNTAETNGDFFDDVFSEDTDYDDVFDETDNDGDDEDDEMLGFTVGEEEESDEDGDAGQSEQVEEQPKDEKKPEEKPAKKEQSPELNAEFARQRREREEKERIAKATEEARIAAIIEAVGKNPYTNEEMKDAEDVREYLAMREIEKSGGNPVEDYSKHQKEQNRAKAKEAKTSTESDEKDSEWFANDKKEFAEKYPEIDDAKLKELFDDEAFKAYADGKVGKMPLAKIYEGFKAFEEKIASKYSDEAEAKMKRIEANAKAAVGSLSSPESGEPQYYTNEQIKKMSRSEINKNYAKVLASIEHNTKHNK